MSVAEQSRNFCLFFIIGLFIGFIFDLFRGFRKSFKTSNIVVDIQDVLFLLISGVLFFRSVVIFNSGDIRFYLVLSTFLGILIYSLTISESCVIIVNVILRTIKFTVQVFFKFILKIFISLKKFLYSFRKTKTKE